MIKLVILDIDGCLSDGKIIYSPNADLIKEFNVKDGAAILKAKELGIKFAIITGRSSEVVLNRARDLGIEYVYCGIKDKLSCAKTLLKDLNITFDEVAAIGDYYNDLDLLKSVKLPFIPKDGAKIFGRILNTKGGYGCVHEMLEIIVKENNQLKQWIKC
ncbi:MULTISPECIES: HAD-IIIA family hydrolase [unclassified Campylobacter]|uniref:KdsC family phosphatase n=1 Tax=unclassified Campylobacter TaxID=2593542 RepID=UPI001BDB205B|nr:MULTISPECIES: HAD-IIIA family hydrolase [unclassified Campylobacter]MBZ7976093.1 HAD-IIIA family hydrolase [Campylobacter sp. RM12637]MBZ7978218.1 HAD-IIIA family hydrolase [Campylobacter sp. RM12654]MBZ7980227.1 HAD-IIIA family hydrolase [Campylobacter sp. RM12642]MBZ7982180.1 HAD-IIIA family hydrolase [Campylobacter sp. RM12640]MBZ7983673.1 HAD-IIIA family hydrolase [Campylobacter sp. RM12647]MBZ7989369.1 HAD-IIIA family hydrolase [Campylobacter sp. RM12635]MBZ7991088.1 HAD-IIIA family 